MNRIDPRDLRNAFGSFLSGVTVVTALQDDGTPVGFTANSFSSVSLDPPLLLVCPGKFLSSFAAFETCTHFAISILSEGQEEVSNVFASYKGDRFAKVPHSLDANCVPVIDGATAQFSCSTHQAVPAGDHCILIGQVTEFTHSERPGLGYVGGQYFSRGLERAAFEQTTGAAICGAIIEDGDTVLLEQTPDGLRPVQTAQTDPGQLITDLQNMLTAKGVTAELGQAYSVYQSVSPRAQFSYFLATGKITTPAPDIVALPISQITQHQFSTPAIARMMARFALEARSRNFALYLGDTEDGAVHEQPKRT